ncbi:MAG: outer membrane protein assembly factor BamA [Proteobacteria bacterium]|nr:outer membrane protein assembly factor BamA [Pseudomonadota bacterium]
MPGISPLRSLRALAVLVSLLVSSAGVGAAEDVVREIVVEGTQRIEPETVRSYMIVQVGDRFSDVAMDRTLKALYATGLFADVAVRREGDRLVVRVVENPVINRIAFEGNRAISDKDLQNEVQLKPRLVYTRTKVQADVERMLTAYRRKGRFAASVEPKIIRLDQNRVDLVFEIAEGEVTKVQRINVVGNKFFSDSQLRDEIQTKEARWYRFFTSDDTYDPDRLTFDRELLRRYYLKNGFADFQVLSAVAELAPDRSAFFVTFTVEEGPRYKFGTFDIESRLADLDTSTLAETITIKGGGWYNAEEVENSIQALTEAVNNAGFAFVDIRPLARRNPAERTIDVRFEVQEGPRVYIERINIVGNVRTLDKVVRREFRLAEGDAFNAAKLRRSRQRIKDLNFFKNVDMATQPGSRPDRMVVEVKVDEKPTGEITFGAGYSTTEGALVDVGLRERNLLGKGQDLRVGAMFSERKTEFDVRFTEPYFTNRPLAAGIDAFYITRNNQRQSRYDERTVGSALRLGYDITGFLRHGVTYTVSGREVENVKDDASRFIKEQEGKSTVSMIGQTFTYDRRNSKLEPSEGYVARLGNDVAGVGGSVSYVRLRLDGGYYIPLSGNRWVISLSGSTGYVVGLDQNVRIVDRFFLGGDTLRGFEVAGVGPRDRETRDALGGRLVYFGSTELRFPLGVAEELGMLGRVFSDFGALQMPEESGPEVFDSGALRMSVGVGLSWRTPLGLLNIDLATPILKQSLDEEEMFRFSFGTRF